MAKLPLHSVSADESSTPWEDFTKTIAYAALLLVPLVFIALMIWNHLS